MSYNNKFLIGVVDLDTGAGVAIKPIEIKIDEYNQWVTHYEFDRVVDKDTPSVLLGSETFSADFKVDQVNNAFLRNVLGMRPAPHSLSPENVERIIFNPPATIVFWKDGTKTVVKCMDDDTYDPEKGVLLAFLKKSLHNSSTALRKQLEEWTGELEEQYETV